MLVFLSSNLSFSAKVTLENITFSRVSFCLYPNRTPTDIQRLSIYRRMISAQFRIIVSDTCPYTSMVKATVACPKLLDSVL